MTETINSTPYTWACSFPKDHFCPTCGNPPDDHDVMYHYWVHHGTEKPISPAAE